MLDWKCLLPEWSWGAYILRIVLAPTHWVIFTAYSLRKPSWHTYWVSWRAYFLDKFEMDTVWMIWDAYILCDFHLYTFWVTFQFLTCCIRPAIRRSYVQQSLTCNRWIRASRTSRRSSQSLRPATERWWGRWTQRTSASWNTNYDHHWRYSLWKPLIRDRFDLQLNWDRSLTNCS